MNNEAPARKEKTPKAKIFGTYIVSDDGSEKLLQYTEHYSKPQAQSKALEGRLETREATIDELMEIGAQGIGVVRLDSEKDDAQADAFPGNE